MKTRRLFLSLSLLLAAGIVFTFLTSLKNPSDFFKKGKISFQLLSQDFSSLDTHFLNLFSKDNPGNKPTVKSNNSKGNKVKGEKSINMNWTEMGPDNIGGRTRAVLIDKSNENLFFAGSVTGGLWKSTTGGLSWEKVTGGDMFDNICVSSICQASNGDIYFGTGEYYATYNNVHGFHGQGIWKSTDHGTTWTHLTSTWNTTDNSKQIFYYVNKLASPSNNASKIYAATAAGLMISSDGGATWSNPITDSNGNMVCTDVQVSKDDQVVVISLNNLTYVCNTGNDVFVDKSGTIPSGLGRIEFAIAPSNSNYIYCLAADANGGLKNVYQSTDKGDTWTALIPIVNGQFMPFGTYKLGLYENSIAVFPDNPEHILLGGENLFEWSPTSPWEQITTNVSIFYYPLYISAGIHSIFFSANYSTTNNKVIVGTDGGVFSSEYAGAAWTQMNKRYNTTQFNSVAFSNDGKVIGGARNHGTLYISKTGTNVQDAVSIFDGDGGFCEYSVLNPSFLFATKKVYGTTTQYGILARSDDNGVTMSSVETDLFNPYVTPFQLIADTSYMSDLHPIRLWESFYDTSSTQYITYKAGRTLHLNDTVDVTSSCKRIIKHIINTSDLNGYSSILKDSVFKVKDTYQSMLAIALKNSVWITREGLDLSKVPPKWYRIANTSSTVKTITDIEFSTDGNYLYFTDYSRTLDSSIVYRCSNLINGRDSLTGSTVSDSTVIQTQIIGTFAHKVTGIAVDPQNANNVLITLGNYNITNGLYYSNNAATTTSTLAADNFVSKQGDLPLMPVYCGLINWNNSLQVFIGTEYGVYATENITDASPTWTEQNANGMAHVPVMQLHQQIHDNGWFIAPMVDGGFNTGITNHGVIYAATFGRGIFSCEDYKTPVNVPEITTNKVMPQIIVYPNPVKDMANISFKLDSRGDLGIKIYDIKGNVVKTVNYNNLSAGDQSISFSTTGLSTGTYIVEMEKNHTRSTAKFVKY